METDNIHIKTMEAFASDMFEVLEMVKSWKEGDDNEFDSVAVNILEQMKEYQDKLQS
jgi:hypothetical protein